MENDEILLSEEEMICPEVTDCNVVACFAIPAAQVAIALVPAVPSLCWVAAAAA